MGVAWSFASLVSLLLLIAYYYCYIPYQTNLNCRPFLSLFHLIAVAGLGSISTDIERTKRYSTVRIAWRRSLEVEAYGSRRSHSTALMLCNPPTEINVTSTSTAILTLLNRILFLSFFNSSLSSHSPLPESEEADGCRYECHVICSKPERVLELGTWKSRVRSVMMDSP